MSAQIKPSVTNPTIADIYQNIESGKLVLRPDFQRKFVWTTEHQEEFIDTILKGYPFPEIYVCQGEIDIQRLKTIEHVIDGQQRLTTIKNYIDGTLKSPFRKVQNYADLQTDEKAGFVGYKLVVRDLGKIEDSLVREIFRRINLTKFKLEDVEIHNAIYDGAFIKTAKSILQDTDLSIYGVFKESEFSRMADLHFVMLVMATVESGGYFPRDNDNEIFIAKFNEEYPNAKHVKAGLLKVFAIINDLELDLDSIWFRKSNFFTLVVEFYWALNRIPSDAKDRLITFEKEVLLNKGENNEFGRYYGFMYSGTTARKARIERSRMFKQYILNIDTPRGKFIEHLRALETSALEREIDGKIADSSFEITQDDIFVSEMSMSNASGWDIDSYEVNIDNIQFEEHYVRIPISYTATGDQDEDRSWNGTIISGTAIAVINAEGHVTYEDVTAVRDLD